MRGPLERLDANEFRCGRFTLAGVHGEPGPDATARIARQLVSVLLLEIQEPCGSKRVSLQYREMKQAVINSEPKDASTTRALAAYKGLDARYHDWATVAGLCQGLAAALIVHGSAPP